MADAGANALRTYVAPPAWLLDTAAERGLHVMVGLPWEQHVAFLDEPARAKADRRQGRRAGSCLRRSPGNPLLRDRQRDPGTDRPLERQEADRAIPRASSSGAPKRPIPTGSSPTSTTRRPSTSSFPSSTSAAFNVFLEDEKTFENYLARLQTLSGDRPLLVTEAGLDSRRHGQEAQAEAITWQVRHAFGTGAAGVFVFSWTDEWHRGGHDVLDWEFGIVDRERRPKHSLAAVRDTFAAAPFPPPGRPRDLGDRLHPQRRAPPCRSASSGVEVLDYPDYEVIVVDDGSTDDSAEIARDHGSTCSRPSTAA